MANNAPNKTNDMFSQPTYLKPNQDNDRSVPPTESSYDEDFGDYADATRAIFLGIDLLKRLAVNDDRTLAVVSTAFLDELLLRHLRLAMHPGSATSRLLSHQGALGTMSARIDMCEGLGILKPEYANELRILASVRNAFAHRIDIENFEHLEKSCENLMSLTMISEEHLSPFDYTPRGRFIAAFRRLALWIPNSWQGVSPRRAPWSDTPV